MLARSEGACVTHRVETPRRPIGRSLTKYISALVKMS